MDHKQGQPTRAPHFVFQGSSRHPASSKHGDGAGHRHHSSTGRAPLFVSTAGDHTRHAREQSYETSSPVAQQQPQKRLRTSENIAEHVLPAHEQQSVYPAPPGSSSAPSQQPQEQQTPAPATPAVPQGYVYAPGPTPPPHPQYGYQWIQIPMPPQQAQPQGALPVAPGPQPPSAPQQVQVVPPAAPHPQPGPTPPGAQAQAPQQVYYYSPPPQSPWAPPPQQQGPPPGYVAVAYTSPQGPSMPVAPFLQIAGQPPPGPAQTAPQPQAYQYPGYYAPPPAPGPLPAPQYAPLKYQVQQQEQQAHMQPPAPQHYQQQQAPPRPPQHHGLQSPPMAPLPGSQFRPSLPQGPSLPGTYRQAQYDLQGHVQGRQGQFQSPQANMQRPPASTLPQSPLAAGSKVDTAKNRAININKRITTATQAKEILDIVNYEIDAFDTVALATAVHRLASLRGAPNLHEQITQSPEFFKLVTTIKSRASELAMRNLANVLWGMARMNYLPSEDIMQTLCREVGAKAETGVAQNVANTLWALSSLQYCPEDVVLKSLANAVRSKIHDFTSQHISNTVLAFAKLEFAIDHDILEALGREALGKIGTFTAQALSNTLWSLSKLGISNGELFSAVGAAARSNMQNFNPQNLANSVWAYGNLGINPGEDVLEEYAAYAGHKINEFTPQNLSNFVWALAKLGVFNEEFFRAAAWRGVQTMHCFTAQSVANFLWAYATLGRAPDPAFLRAAVHHSKPKLDQWAAQNLSNVAWALAVLKDEPIVQSVLPSFLPSIVAEVTSRLRNAEKKKEFSRQHLANYIWALAVVDYNPGQLSLRTLLDTLQERVHDCNPQELSNIVWACAKLQLYDANFLDLYAEEAASRMDEFGGQNLFNVAWAYAKLGHYHTDLMAAIADVAISQTEELSVAHIINILWAFSVLNFPAPRMIEAMLAEVQRRMSTEQLTPQNVANLLWSTAVADALEPQFWQMCMQQLHPERSGCEFSELSPETSSQIFQAHLLVTARHPEADWAMDPVLLARGQETWSAAVHNIKVSEFHSEVSRTLQAMGVAHALEHLTEDGFFSIDIALPNERIAIEVDGRHHFTRNSLRPLGEMFSRTTLLEARGWRIISVPYFQWAGVDEDARRTYLQNLLDRARAGQSTHPTKDENDRRSARPVVSLMQLTWTAPQPVSVPSPPQTTPHYAAAPTRVNGGGNGSQAGHVWEPPTDPR